ncbi:hypothetical protein RB195_009723 [Necator americanus]|uniref:Reverse transcriptase domain-containing protein n=1 Tax=Necator americanus TaxID=51031 RepID=A0ABR1CUL8_NECAM
MDGQPIELVDDFCFLGCVLKNNSSYEKDIQQRCTKAVFTFNFLTKCLWSTPITNEVKLRVYLSAIRPIMMYGSETWAAPSTLTKRLVYTERKLLRRLLGYFSLRTWNSDEWIDSVQALAEDREGWGAVFKDGTPRRRCG